VVCGWVKHVKLLLSLKKPAYRHVDLVLLCQNEKAFQVQDIAVVEISNKDTACTRCWFINLCLWENCYERYSSRRRRQQRPRQGAGAQV